MSDKDPHSQPLSPVVVEDIDLVRVEKSLNSLGFFASTANREISRTVVQVYRRPDGQRIHAKAVIEGIPSLGLPTTADRDKYMAFMKLALDQRELHGELSNPVRFTGADMIRLLGLRKGGFHYDEINEWCKRMVATTIMSESSIFLADRKQYATDTFHVFDRVVLVGEETNDGIRSEFYQVYLSHWQLTNVNQAYLLPLDFNAYLKLRRDISKALFGHLSVWFYASRGQSIEKNYADLCQLLNIRAYPHVSKARSVLAPSLDELIDIGYLSSWDLSKSNRAGQFKLSLSPGQRLLELPNFAKVVRPEFRATIDSQVPSWLPDLLLKGVAEKKARQLALEIPEDQAVSDQIEYAQYLIDQDRRGRGKISNPAGFFIWAIESNLSVPASFESSRKRQIRQAQEEADTQERRHYLQLVTEYEQYREDEITNKLASEPTDVYEAALKEQLKGLKREQPEWFARVGEQLRREVATSKLRAATRESLKIPTFDQWSRRDRQQALF